MDSRFTGEYKIIDHIPLKKEERLLIQMALKKKEEKMRASKSFTGENEPMSAETGDIWVQEKK
jgi:hypothetical protein